METCQVYTILDPRMDHAAQHREKENAIKEIIRSTNKTGVQMANYFVIN